MKIHTYLIVALTAALTGCSTLCTDQSLKYDPKQQNPQVTVIDSDPNAIKIIASEDPIVLSRRALEVNSIDLFKTGQLREAKDGSRTLEAKISWQLPATSTYQFAGKAGEAVPQPAPGQGISIDIVAPLPSKDFLKSDGGAYREIKNEFNVANHFKDCNKNDDRTFSCWVSLNRAIIFKYSITLVDGKGNKIHVDPTGVVY
jgi:hypothetical protein